MNLGKQIHTLLKRQPSVYVKGLGTFRRNHQSASFDAKRNVYLPPMTFIEFENDSSDGFNFVAYVQQIHQIDRQQAEVEVDLAVNQLLDKMNQHGEAMLDSLGHLVSYGTYYVFKPLDLSGFQYSPIVDEVKKVDSPEVIAPADIVPPEGQVDTAEILDDTSEMDTPESTAIVLKDEIIEEGIQDKESDSISLPPLPVVEENEPEVIPIKEHPAAAYEAPTEEKNNNSLIYIIVAVLSLITLGGLYYYNQIIEADKGNVQQPVTPIVRDTLPAVDSNALAIDTNQVVQDSLLSKDTAVTEVPIIQEVIKKYTIIIGTHKSLADATRDAEAYHKKGHKSVKVLTPNLSKNNKRVVWDTYVTKEERDSALAYVRKNIKPDAWPDVVR